MRIVGHEKALNDKPVRTKEENSEVLINYLQLNSNQRFKIECQTVMRKKIFGMKNKEKFKNISIKQSVANIAILNCH